MTPPTRWLSWTLAATLPVLFLASLQFGPSGVPLSLALSDWLQARDGAAATILVEIRAPRAFLGLAIGFALGVSGAALQGLLRNPLAEPGLIGVSGGAALGAVVAFYGGFAAAFPLALPVGGLVGAGLGVGALLLLAGRDASTTTLILAGVALNALFGALTSLALAMSPNPYALAEIVFWMLGSLQDRSLDHLALTAPFMLAGMALLLTTGRGLDALTLGEDTAKTLGIDMRRLRLRVLLGVTLSVGAGVAAAGVIGFVGLIAPHLIRPLVGHRPGGALLASGLAGAALLTAADTGLRLSEATARLPLGVLTALIGAPFFLRLVLTARKEAW